MNKALSNHMSLHKNINTVLTVVVFLLGLYIVLFPYLPQLGWWWSHRNKAPFAGSSAPTDGQSDASIQTPIPNENLLIVPRLDMRQAIHSGQSVSELNKGAWLIPGSSRPDKQSNSVIVGHRFIYSGPAVFYFLDKIQVNDFITVYWEQKEYTYKVATIKVVPPTDLSVEAPSLKPQLTLYTCTPIWSAKDRLVITAPLEGVRQ